MFKLKNKNVLSQFPSHAWRTVTTNTTITLPVCFRHGRLRGWVGHYGVWATKTITNNDSLFRQLHWTGYFPYQKLTDWIKIGIHSTGLVYSIDNSIFDEVIWLKLGSDVFVYSIDNSHLTKWCNSNLALEGWFTVLLIFIGWGDATQIRHWMFWCTVLITLIWRSDVTQIWHWRVGLQYC